ncbi:MAG: hypothetical protein M1817_002266 [Caeruleum heppii]|nr:MAG: hypothetical protein M1817_002266 [Caeruleum heppii]
MSDIMASPGAWGSNDKATNWESSANVDQNGGGFAGDMSGRSGDARNNVSKHEDGLGGPGPENDESCRNCGQEGHFARDCPEPRKDMGACFNCGETGHNKVDCPNPKVFTGSCRICLQEGHPAALCPDRPADVCKNCRQEGHRTAECTNKRLIDYSDVPDMTPDAAWDILKKADKEKELDDFREAMRVYCKAVPDTTFVDLEKAFRRQDFKTFLIAVWCGNKEKQTTKGHTIVDLQGNLNMNYQVQYHFTQKPKRIPGVAESAEENLTRLEKAGFVMDSHVIVCSKCEEIGHGSKFCKADVPEHERVVVKCANCEEVGHRARDCPKERVDKFACRNCKKPGHKADECEEPPNLDGVECRRCNETGHFAKDCPNSGGGDRTCRNCGKEGHISKDCEEPRNPANTTCRNCDQQGHMSRDCPEPKNWSKVKCNNCGEMGHTVKRCKQPVPDNNDDAFGGDAGNEGPSITEVPAEDFMAFEPPAASTRESIW